MHRVSIALKHDECLGKEILYLKRWKYLYREADFAPQLRTGILAEKLLGAQRIKMLAVFYSKCVPSLSNSILTSVTYTVTFPQFERNNTLDKLADISAHQLRQAVEESSVSRASRLRYPSDFYK